VRWAPYTACTGPEHKCGARCSTRSVQTPVALSLPGSQKIFVEGKDVVPDVWEVLDKIKAFTDKVSLWAV
jgi:hypothetical protein